MTSGARPSSRPAETGLLAREDDVPRNGSVDGGLGGLAAATNAEKEVRG